LSNILLFQFTGFKSSEGEISYKKIPIYLYKVSKNILAYMFHHTIIHVFLKKSKQV